MSANMFAQKLARATYANMVSQKLARAGYFMSGLTDCGSKVIILTQGLKSYYIDTVNYLLNFVKWKRINNQFFNLL